MTRPISSRAGSPAGAALVGLAPKEVCQRTFCDAVPARAATPAGPSLLRVSGVAGITIASIAFLYFGAQLLRGVL